MKILRGREDGLATAPDPSPTRDEMQFASSLANFNPEEIDSCRALSYIHAARDL